MSGDFEFERIAFFSDAVFAIAITVLVLDIHVGEHLDPAHLKLALNDLWPTLGAFALSFVVIGRFWMLHHRLFSYLSGWDPRLAAYNLAFLATVVILPFPTRLLAGYGDQAVAAAIYAGVVMACSGMLTALWRHVVRDERRLLAETVTEAEIRLWNLRAAVLFAMFALAIPVVFISPLAGEAIWWLTFPVIAILHRVHGRASSSAEAADGVLTL